MTATKSAGLFLLIVVASCAPIDFEYADGAAGRYSEWRGHWVFINYWAEWCAPCRYEIPQLNALNKAQPANDLRVVGVNFDGVEGDALRALMQRMSIEFPVTTKDPRERFGYELPVVLPTTVVIDPNGEVAATLVGPQTESTLRAVMEVSAAPT
ncbi:MAG TPA: TlpA disulfide reductase family protein [Pseudomonadales bacterium]|nr:TlpA disulfide reductase family protein [Pseudomonadales bacterium]